MNDAPGAAHLLPLWRVYRIVHDGALDGSGVLVVDKPIGIPVYGGDEQLTHGLTERLAPWLRSMGREPHLGIHQRLDQETSGVIFFVQDKSKNAAFAEAMGAHKIRRTYVAVVETRATSSSGQTRELPAQGTLDVWISPGREGVRVSGTRPPRASPETKRAITHYRVLGRAGSRALVELRLETGRTHQIRASLAHIGHPVLGDRLYGGAPYWRLLLHASSLAGPGFPREFSAELPAAFRAALGPEGEGFPKDARTLLVDAATLRAPLVAHTSAFRLVNGAGDGLPGLTVDVYGKFAVVNLAEDALVPRARELAELVQMLGYEGVYVKHRLRADLRTKDARELAPSGPLVGSAAPASYWVQEFDQTMQVDLSDGLSTGLFLDMRDNRIRTRQWAGTGRMLNLFSYTCSFSVAAARAGAMTTSVDLSGKALDRGRANFVGNGLVPENHRFFKEDAMKFLARAVRRGDTYDFIVLDPPSFATVGKGTFSVKARYEEAASECFRLLSPGGRLLCVTNHTKTSPRHFYQMVMAAAQAAGRKLSALQVLSPGLDFPPDADGPSPSKSLLAQVL